MANTTETGGICPECEAVAVNGQGLCVCVACGWSGGVRPTGGGWGSVLVGGPRRP